MENLFSRSIELLEQHLNSLSTEEFVKEWDALPSVDYGTFTIENYLSLVDFYQKRNTSYFTPTCQFCEIE